MKFKVNIGAIRDAVGLSKATIDRLSGMETSHLFIKAQLKDGKGSLYLFTTDMVSKTLIKVPAEVETEGEVLIVQNLISSLLSALPEQEEIEFSTSQKSTLLRVQFGSIKSRLEIYGEGKSMNPYLALIPFNQKPIFTMSAEALISILNRSLFCVGDREGTALVDVLFQSIEGGYAMFASDNHIASRAVSTDSNSKNTGQTAQIPGRSLQPLQRLLAKRKDQLVQIIMSTPKSCDRPTEVYFRFEDVMFGTRLGTHTFPDVNKIISQASSTQRISLPREALQQTLMRCVPFAQNRAVKLEVNSGEEKQLRVKAHNHGNIHSETLDLTTFEKEDGIPDKVEVTLSIDYLLNIVGSNQHDTIQIGISGEDYPVQLQDVTETGPETEYILSVVKPLKSF